MRRSEASRPELRSLARPLGRPRLVRHAKRLAGGLVAVLLLGGCASSAEPGDPGDGGARGDAATADDEGAATGASTPSVSGPTYVALGDSFTSAPGVGRSTGPSACFRTDANYPHLLAERLGLRLVDVSCAGATSRDLRFPQAGIEDAGAQLDAITPDTALVTLSIGANDDGLFGALATQCVDLGFGQGAPCSQADRFADAGVRAELAALEQETVRSVRAIRERAPDAEVVVVGYPQLVPASGTCDLLPLAAVDVPFVREVNRRLAAALERGARSAGVAYADMWAASEGHDACADEPWIAGRRPVGPGAPLHPYAAHQEAVADEVAALVD